MIDLSDFRYYDDYGDDERSYGIFVGVCVVLLVVTSQSVVLML